MTRPVCLIIMDGLAYGVPTDDEQCNAVCRANTPVLDELWRTSAHSFLQASGEAVGLPVGQMGNSEVGHLNMGAGRVVYQELTRIDHAIADGSFFNNEVLRAACQWAREHTGRLHLMGLLSDGGVHSSQEHLYALLRLAAREQVPEVLVHCFLDGRDTPPDSAAGYLAQLEEKTVEIGVGRIASIMGRYYAMDRDRRWERVQRAYDCLTGAAGRDGIGLPPRGPVSATLRPPSTGSNTAPPATAPDALSAINASYAAGITDEFVEPTLIGAPAPISDDDALIFFNFRPDRARELSYAFTCPDFDGFARANWPRTHFVCLCEYDPALEAAVAFPKEYPADVLADVIAAAGLRQFHTAETEKYAHVTFFFNGGSEPPKPGEERRLVASPKVATYDLQPEMSAVEVTDGLVAAIRAGESDFYVVNFANGDMVGHTGVLEATIRAVETVDTQVGRVVEAMRSVGGLTLITADHGNAEDMGTEAAPQTAHTTSEVPFIAVGEGAHSCQPGRLCDVAATAAAALGVAPPRSWTGKDLLS
ncbi:MAG: 2,3-bisphosphoglycerate-independent phosphoglycerate mutase [Actinomycetia bacterium]|nr:2,3-bisphosphoglycerate-independent phosphoglycerate mutase [Actinomycetes bacterium]